MYDVVDETGLSALQLYVQKFKQADLTLTGTVRKATLVNQSTKAPNPVSVAPSSNRKASTTTITNGTSLTGRCSISHGKVEDMASENSVGGSTSEKKCVTCNVDVSPKWWPCPLVVAGISPAALGHPIAPNGDHPMDGSPQVNGHSSQVPVVENGGGGNIALAAAALHQNTRQPVQAPVVTEFQCHKCHWKKVRREPTPPSSAPPVQREPSRPPIPVPPVSAPAPSQEADVPRGANQYAWRPPPPAYPQTQAYNNWQRPAPHNVSHVSQLNGGHSAHTNNGPISQMNGQPPMRQSVQGIPHSPHENGHMSQGPNGYSQPPSPRRGLGSAPLHMSNGVYTSYATTRPSPPQHLTNGGPPPRAPEHPFQQSNAVMHSRPPFGPHHGSPPMARDTHPQRPDPNNPQNDTRPNDGRVNGGASASPSLRNLLS